MKWKRSGGERDGYVKLLVEALIPVEAAREHERDNAEKGVYYSAYPDEPKERIYPADLVLRYDDIAKRIKAALDSGSWEKP